MTNRATVSSPAFWARQICSRLRQVCADGSGHMRCDTEEALSVLARGAASGEVACVRPEDIEIATTPTGRDNCFPGRITDLVQVAGSVRYRVAVTPSCTLSVRASAERRATVLTMDDAVYVGWDAADMLVMHQHEPLNYTGESNHDVISTESPRAVGCKHSRIGHAAHRARAAAKEGIVVANTGGAFEAAMDAALFKPFTAKTGIEVVKTVNVYAKLKAMVEANAGVDWDVAQLDLPRPRPLSRVRDCWRNSITG